MTNIIDSDDYKASGVETLFFPGGEPHAKIPPALSGDVVLHLKPRTWNDVGLGACVADALTRSPNVSSVKAFIPYFPAARQDQDNPCAPLTISLMARLFDFEGPIHVFDPHSDAVKQWTDAGCWMPSDLLIPTRPDVVGIIAPDEGATKRAILFQTVFYPRTEFVQCMKKRDPVSGALSGYHLPPLPRPGRYIIVDDICDGGGTFNLLTAEYAKDPLADQSPLEMFVSHGIFSKGIAAIDARIERITTTDSWCRPILSALTERVQVIPLLPILQKIMGSDNA